MTNSENISGAASPDGGAAPAASDGLRTAPAPPDSALTVYGQRLPVAIRYAGILADTGVSHGLIGPREVERVWERHVLNCAVVESLIPEGATVVDVGSGAGLPGLAIAIARPDLTIHLVEPMARRVAWLDDAVAMLDLTGVFVHRGRADEVDVTGSVVTARAVSKLSTLAGWMAPLAEDGALMLALKGASAADELTRDRAAATRAGWTDFEVVTAGDEVLDQPTTVIRARRHVRPVRSRGRDRRGPRRG